MVAVSADTDGGSEWHLRLTRSITSTKSRRSEGIEREIWRGQQKLAGHPIDGPTSFRVEALIRKCSEESPCAHEIPPLEFAGLGLFGFRSSRRHTTSCSRPSPLSPSPSSRYVTATSTARDALRVANASTHPRTLRDDDTAAPASTELKNPSVVSTSTEGHSLRSRWLLKADESN